MRSHSIGLLISIALGISASAPAGSEVPFAGKSGLGLAQTIRREAAPKHLPEAKEMNFTVKDPFAGVTVEVCEGVLPAGYVAGQVIPSAYWEEMPTHGDSVARDLANYLPLNADVVKHRQDFTPGAVEKPSFESALWRAGLTAVGSMEVPYYEPPEAMRGQLARTLFYLVTVYPQSIWSPRGYMLMDGSIFPALNAYALGLLLPWHRAYPPSAEEEALCKRMAEIQGNENPFVSRPDLAEYLWGDKAGLTYEAEGEPVPLHSSYRLADDFIYLTTPLAPADATWTIDGSPAEKARYAPSELGVGEHHLTFHSNSTQATGRVMIKILP